jgi:hypothetical protein
VCSTEKGTLTLNAYNVLRQAIIDRLQVTCFYQGLHREVCPHVIGRKRGKLHALVFQFAGESSRGLPPGGMWRCLEVDEVTGAEAREGLWHTGDSHLKPQTCVDEVDVEVAY